jgi:hypothetical protein
MEAGLLLFYFTAWRLFSGIVGVCTGLFLSLYTLERYGFNETALRSDFSKEQCMCELSRRDAEKCQVPDTERTGQVNQVCKPSPCVEVCHAGVS